MRTDDEILARIKERKKDDFLGFEISDLIVRLPFDKAKPLLSEPNEEEWTVRPRDRESLLKEMLEYMPFAWGKANDKRGLSAWRSMSHYAAWMWLADDDPPNLKQYEFYGKPQLIMICEKYGWDHTQWDDGVREN